jgi:hypothetical protein
LAVRLRLLKNDKLLIVESITTNKSKAVKMVWKGRLPMHPRARPAERLIGT